MVAVDLLVELLAVVVLDVERIRKVDGEARLAILVLQQLGIPEALLDAVEGGQCDELLMSWHANHADRILSFDACGQKITDRQ